MPDPEPTLSVVIPVHDGGDAFVRCLEALGRARFDDREIVVVDDGSSDDSAGAARRAGARVVATDRQRGPAAARNLGARYARGRLLLFLDADCAVHPDTLERAVEALSEQDVDAVFGSYDDDPPVPGLVSRYRNLLHHWTHQHAGREASTFWAGCGGVRREAFEAVGGFDARRYPRPSVEDIDLGVRLRDRGRRIRLVPDLQVTHLKRWSLVGMARTDALARAAPWTELALRSGGLPRDLNVDLRGRLSVAAAGSAAACALASLAWPPALVPTGALALAHAGLNLDLYRFLRRRGGARLAAAAVPLHGLHHLCAGLGSLIGAFRHLRRRGSVSRPPGPRPWPLVGHAPPFVRDRLGFLRRAAREHGPVVRLRLGGETYLLVDPEDVHHVLVTNDANYTKSPRMLDGRARRWAGHGLLTSTGERHLALRRAMQPAFHRDAIARHRDAVLETVDAWIAARRDGETLDIAAEMMRLTHRITGRVLWDADYAGRDAALGRAVVDRRRFIRHVFFSPLPRPESWPLPVVLRHRRALRRLDREARSRIARRRRAPEEGVDLLTMLVRARRRDGTPLTDDEIRDEAITLAVTGWETVGEALSWTWHLVGRHPATALRLQEEVGDVVGNRSPAIDDLSHLRYVAMVLDEALRLYPPTWIWVRMAREPDRLPSGYAVEAGTKLYLCPWVLHRDPGAFPNPDAFAPERFAGGGRPPAEFFPFGKGPHVCIGEPLARTEATLVIARIVQRLAIEPLDDDPVVPEPGITLTPRNGIRARIRFRDPR